jgi:hypothetical protein
VDKRHKNANKHDDYCWNSSLHLCLCESKQFEN